MGGLQLLKTMQQEDCASFVCQTQSGVVGGCTFKMHHIQSASTRLQTLLDDEASYEREPESFVELLLLGVTQKEQKNGLGAQLVHALQNFISATGCSKVVTYADLRALAFFEKQGFVPFRQKESQYYEIRKLLDRCDQSKLMCWRSPSAADKLKRPKD